MIEMIFQSSSGTDRERKLLFSSLQKSEKLWRADRLTSALTRLPEHRPQARGHHTPLRRRKGSLIDR
jgi:hypothetical protein